MSGFGRWWRFNLVGAGGVLVQLGLLQAWMHFALGNYLLGTVLAVEGAVLHNFGWHCAYTWKDRPARQRAEIWGRLARFHLSNGAVSVAGNLLIMRALVDGMGVPVLVANVVAIVSCSVVNFFLGDRWVFQATTRSG
ncbi:GtrA-like protein [Candidatus Koribacter versatilis Ellin345]|uniref:GtrA-like protein n=1 Tax=Koribacter versatilis (strain Ellin345) TaxID=204669 RepID=Q1IIX2_KORVE|nr:GtrA family protein [Candidatus Koribacter versatilis]ABF43178.1 GtrA-like protein [Candidatus Koribacter versatilis Ellin345]